MFVADLAGLDDDLAALLSVLQPWQELGQQVCAGPLLLVSVRMITPARGSSATASAIAMRRRSGSS